MRLRDCLGYVPIKETKTNTTPWTFVKFPSLEQYLYEARKDETLAHRNYAILKKLSDGKPLAEICEDHNTSKQNINYIEKSFLKLWAYIHRK
jgi:DNA-binding NarL/FixJ family response regulator